MVDVEHLDPPRQSRKTHFLGLPVTVADRELAPLVGRYEFRLDQLVMTFPSDLRGGSHLRVPARMESSAGSGVDLITFERVKPPNTAIHVPTVLNAVVEYVSNGKLPTRLGGWDVAVTPDWALTGVDPARQLRFTARLDGSVTFAPVRP